MAALLVDGERCLCATTARLLAATARSAGSLGLLAAGLAALTLTSGLLVGRPAAAGQAVILQGLLAPALVLGLVPFERVLALRLRFDAGLFDDLARGAHAPTAALASLDHALQALRLRAPAAAPRPLLARVHGARRLLFWHVLVVVLQSAGVVCGQFAMARGMWP